MKTLLWQGKPERKIYIMLISGVAALVIFPLLTAIGDSMLERVGRNVVGGLGGLFMMFILLVMLRKHLATPFIPITFVAVPMLLMTLFVNTILIIMETPAIVAISAPLTAALFIVMLRYHNTINYEIHTDRVVVEYGRLIHTRRVTTYDKITDISELTLPGKRHQILYATTAGSTLAFGLIVKDEKIRQLIQQQRNNIKPTATTKTTTIKNTKHYKIGKLLTEIRPTKLGLVSDIQMRVIVLIITAVIIMTAVRQISSDNTYITLLSLTMTILPLYMIYQLVVFYLKTNYLIHEKAAQRNSGLIAPRHVEVPYYKITDIHITQNLFGKIFDFGTIILNTAGSQGVAGELRHVKSPHEIKKQLQKLRAAESD